MLKILNHSKLDGYKFDVYDKEFIVAKILEEQEHYAIWIAPTKYTNWGSAVSSIQDSFVIKVGRKLKTESFLNGKYCYPLISSVCNDSMYVLEALQSASAFMQAVFNLTKHYVDNGKIA